MIPHKDLEFEVEDGSGNRRLFNIFNAAAGFALSMSVSRGSPVNVDVLCWSEAGARAWGGDDAVEEYREDPTASVFERIVVRAESQGRVA